MTFNEMVKNCWQNQNSMLCVGLDPDLHKMPECVKETYKPFFEFNKAIIDATYDLVCAYKPQFAYYAAYNAEDQLHMTIDYIKKNYPDIPVILDVKRGDIGSTAEMYAKEAFDSYKADAITVNPFMGSDCLKPFLDCEDKGVVILCRTSNPSSAEIQNLIADDLPIYKHIATLAKDKWNYNKNVLLVVGATCPDELGEVRAICPDIPFLVPGVGAQGGDVQKVLEKGLTANKDGLIINSSRGIIYAGKDKDFAQASRQAAIELNKTISDCLAKLS